jgi:hypothetical protein
MWNVKWWKDVAERAIRTFVAAFGAWLTVASTTNIDDIHWLRGLALSAIATLISVAGSIGTHGVTGNGPSFTSVYKNNDPESFDRGVVQEQRRGKHDRSGD